MPLRAPVDVVEERADISGSYQQTYPSPTPHERQRGKSDLRLRVEMVSVRARQAVIRKQSVITK